MAKHVIFADKCTLIAFLLHCSKSFEINVEVESVLLVPTFTQHSYLLLKLLFCCTQTRWVEPYPNFRHHRKSTCTDRSQIWNLFCNVSLSFSDSIANPFFPDTFLNVLYSILLCLTLSHWMFFYFCYFYRQYWIFQRALKNRKTATSLNYQLCEHIFSIFILHHNRLQSNSLDSFIWN